MNTCNSCSLPILETETYEYTSRTDAKQHDFTRFGQYHYNCHPYGSDLVEYIHLYGYNNIYACVMCYLPMPSNGCFCDDCEVEVAKNKAKFAIRDSDSDSDFFSDDDLPPFPPPLVRQVGYWKASTLKKEGE